MTTASIAAAAFGAMIVTGTITLIHALRPHRRHEPPPRQRPTRLTARIHRVTPRTRALAAASLAAGLALAVTTGWLVAIIIIPAVALGLPYLLAAPPAHAQIARVEAMEEWTRSLAGVLGAGVGLEQAMTATLRSTPEAIKPEVSTLIARLRARWDTEAALRAFAEDLDDVTGDLIAANLILAARRRNRSLASALHAIAESVAEDVAARRRLEAGRAKPRGSARLVTAISVTALAVLALTGQFISPYRTPLGQIILIFLLTLYALGLWWMRRMAQGAPLPRILGPTASAGAR